MWGWEIISGSLYDLRLDKPVLIARGYSGRNLYKNQPSGVTIPHVGPVPPGAYKIGPSYTHPHLGPVVMDLIPVAGDMFGRSEFRIHGDSKVHFGDASRGCIVLPHADRLTVSESTDRVLIVVAEFPKYGTA
jgi:hypothetical protein